MSSSSSGETYPPKFNYRGLLAAGHIENFTFSKSFSKLFKKAKTKEVEFYCWLYSLAKSYLVISQNEFLNEDMDYLYSHSLSNRSLINFAENTGLFTCPIEGHSIQNFPLDYSVAFIAFNCPYKTREDSIAYSLLPTDDKHKYGNSYHLFHFDCSSKYFLDTLKTLFVGNSVKRTPDFQENDITIAQQFIKFMPHCTHSYLLLNRDIDSFGLIELDNLIYNMHSPLILDIKFGVRLYGDEAPDYKKKRSISLAASRSHATLGLNFSGMCGYVNQKYVNIPGGKFMSLEGGPSYSTSADFVKLLTYYITAGEKTSGDSIILAKLLLSKLLELYDLFQKQKLISFYGSSLLCIKDTPGNQTESNVDIRNRLKVYMIDFAHVTIWSDKIDDGYIFGLENFIKIVNQVITAIEDLKDFPNG